MGLVQENTIDAVRIEFNGRIDDDNILASASIAGSKLDLTDGTGTVRAYETAGVKYTEISHDGTDGNIDTSSGDLILDPAGGDVKLSDANLVVNDGKYIYVYDSTNADQISMFHDGTNGRIDCNAGPIYLNPTSETYIRGGNGDEFRAYDSDASDYVNLEHTNSGGKLNSVNGYLWLKSGNNAVYFDSGRDSGSTTTHFYWRDTDETQIMYLDTSASYNWLRIGGNDSCDGVFLAYSAGKDKYIQMYHDDANGNVYSSGGDLLLGAAGNEVRVNNDHFAVGNGNSNYAVATDGDYIRMYHDTSYGYIDTASSSIVMTPSTGVVYGTSHKSNDLGTAARAWDSLFADDFTNISSCADPDWKIYDNAIDEVKKIKSIAKKNPKNVTNLYPDVNTMPDFVRPKKKKRIGKGEWVGAYYKDNVKKLDYTELKDDDEKKRIKKIDEVVAEGAEWVGEYEDEFDEDAYSINKMQGLLIQAIQELTTRLEQLENK